MGDASIRNSLARPSQEVETVNCQWFGYHLWSKNLIQMMACTTGSISSSPVGTKTIDMFKENNGLRRSQSGKDLRKQTVIRRSYSDNSLCYCVNRARAASTQPKPQSCRSIGFFPFQITSSIIPNSVRSFLFDPETSKDMNIVEKDTNVVDETEVSSEEENKIKRANWVERLMQIRKEWASRQQQENIDGDLAREEDENSVGDCDADDGGCEVGYGSEGEEEDEVRYDRESFSRLLVRVPLSDTKLFSQLAFLCNMAYVIPEIKAMDLRRYYGIQFVTSSLDKKAEAAAIKDELNQDSIRLPNPRAAESYSANTAEQMRPTRPSIASKIAASAASYVQSCAKDILALGSDSHTDDCTDLCDNRVQPQEVEGNYPRVYKSEVAAYVAASTMTAVVAAGEKEKQEAAKNLQSLHSSPCEWFVCDDPSTYTRCFGSDSLASWQANLLFEPTKFEGTDALVHRGIYEAAKGIYEQFMPEIMDHLNRYGDRAKLQFTGHSLGGSLSLLVNLMLLTRNVVKPSALRPVVTFGSPFVFCGGRKILDYLGLDDSHVHCVMMHRDIVPRAFSCNYPNHVALVLKRLNGPLRSHPCLNKNKVLYSPFGKIFILQPNEKWSPSHPLLPPGNALYALDKTQCGYTVSALNSFLNCPHPLDTLSDPTAYGSEGTILRDHDSSNYLKAVNGVLRQHTRMVFRKARKQRNLLWPLLTSPSPHSWSHENNLQCDQLLTKEVMTSV